MDTLHRDPFGWEEADKSLFNKIVEGITNPKCEGRGFQPDASSGREWVAVGSRQLADRGASVHRLYDSKF